MNTLTTTLLTLSLFGAAPVWAGGPEHGEMHADMASGDPKPLSELMSGMAKPELWIGDDAPALSIASYLKGESVGSIDDEQTYVVEFWATWCGPCIAAFPHLTELQAQYGDEVRFIGVNIWERVSGSERAGLVASFVEDQGERMGYTVALEEGDSMSEGWMRPAGQNGIPAAFVVDGGKIAWIGHPMNLDEALEEVTGGSFDVKAAAAEAWDQRLVQAGFQRLQTVLRDGAWDDAYELGRSMRASADGDPRLLNAIAWYMMVSKESPERNIAFGLDTAREACELTGWEDWMVLDTYAKGLYVTGDPERAAEIQRKAVGIAESTEDIQDQILDDMRASLRMYEE